MATTVFTTGITGNNFKTVLRQGLKDATPTALGVAVAYVSVSGFSQLREFIKRYDVKRVRLVTDTRDGVTHPAALDGALSSGWPVRVVNSLAGTFHPKLYVGGSSFNDVSGIAGVSLVIFGSANLSTGGLLRNAECSLLELVGSLGPSAGKAWMDCWDAGAPLTAPMLRAYEKFFAKRNRRRAPEDLIALGVADEIPTQTEASPPKGAKRPDASQHAMPNTAASTAWAGLQSFTGDYNLQVEFPRDAGAILSRILTGRSVDGSVSLQCEDGIARDFKFKYYSDNGMFRLNVPNSAPKVDWARIEKKGIAIVELDEDRGLITFRIIEPGSEMIDTIDRSLALGTWGRTPTRLYGWY